MYISRDWVWKVSDMCLLTLSACARGVITVLGLCVCLLLAYHLHYWSSLSMDSMNDLQIGIQRFSTRWFRWKCFFVHFLCNPNPNPNPYGMICLLWNPVRFFAKSSLSSFRQDGGNQFRAHPLERQLTSWANIVQHSCEAKASTCTLCPCSLCARDIEVCASTLYNIAFPE